MSLHWTSAELAILAENWGTESPATIARMIQRRTGRRRTIQALCGKASRNGWGKTVPGYITLRELAADLGLNWEVVRAWPRVGMIKAIRRGKRWLVPLDEYDRLTHGIPVHRVSLDEAERKLGYHRETILTLLKAGVLKGKKLGSHWIVCGDSLTQLIEKMKADMDYKPLGERVPYLDARRAADRRRKRWTQRA